MDFYDLVKRREIDLSRQDLVDADLDVLAEVLRTSDVLEDLRLHANRLNLADGKLTDALARNATLRVLKLGNNRIAAEGAKNLAAALKANVALQELYLDINRIGDEGAGSLADALAANKSLRVLYLKGNKISDEGARILAASFETNEGLRTVCLLRNAIANEGAWRLTSALENSGSLERIDIPTRISGGSGKRNRRRNGGRGARDAEASYNDGVEIPHQETIVSKDEQIASLKQLLSTRDQEGRCSGRNGGHGASNAGASSNDGTEIPIQEIVVSKDEQVASLKQSLSTKQKQERIATKDDQIASLKYSLSIKEQELAGKEAEIARKSEDLTTLKKTIDSLERTVASLGKIHQQSGSPASVGFTKVATQLVEVVRLYVGN